MSPKIDSVVPGTESPAAGSCSAADPFAVERFSGDQRTVSI